jgi:hypothetical protein
MASLNFGAIGVVETGISKKFTLSHMLITQKSYKLFVILGNLTDFKQERNARNLQNVPGSVIGLCKVQDYLEAIRQGDS